MKKIVAIVPSAGIGKRFGTEERKTYYLLKDKPVIIWSLKTLSEVTEIKEIIPVVRFEDYDYCKRLFKKYKLKKVRRIAYGGEERQDSVYNGIKLIDDEDCLVLIHDAVRPLVKKIVIEKAINELRNSKENLDGVILGVPAKDTLKEVKGNIVMKTLKREKIWMIQTPQIFYYNSILKAYEKAMSDRFYSTDDSALVEKYGGKIKVIMGMYENIKITTPEDINYAEYLFKKLTLK